MICKIIVMPVLLWCGMAHAACGTDTPPAAITALGITCEVFSDGPFSLATIDTTDAATASNPAGSCSAGYCKWYVNPNFANSFGGAQCPGMWGSCPVTPTSTYSISGGNITLNRTSAYTAGRVDLSTCHATASTGQAGYFGWTISPPFYLEFLAPSYGTGNDASGGEAAIWSLQADYLTIGGPATIMQASELDFIEGPSQKSMNDIWTTGHNAQNEFFQGFNSAGMGQADGTVVIPQNRNPNSDGGLTGLMNSYKNGVVVSGANLTWGTGLVPKYNGGATGTPPGSGPDTNVNGYTTYNTGKDNTIGYGGWCLQLGSGFNQPLTLQYIRVWQAAPPPTPQKGSGIHIGMLERGR